MIVVGVALGIKRTVVALYFGRRTIAIFKPKLEKLLEDIVLVAEVAELAEEANKAAESMAFGGGDRDQTRWSQRGATVSEDIDLMSVKSLANSKWQGVTFHDTTKTTSVRATLSKSNSGVGVGDNDDDGDVGVDSNESYDGTDGIEGEEGDRDILEMEYASFSDVPPERPAHKRSLSKLEQMSNMLDRWQEPVNKLDKVRYR
jgi:hypothetical protein